MVDAKINQRFSLSFFPKCRKMKTNKQAENQTNLSYQQQQL